MLDYLKKNKYTTAVVITCVVVCIVFITSLGVVLPKIAEEAKNTDINLPTLEIKGMTHVATQGTYVMTEEEFEEFKTTEPTITFSTYEDYVTTVSNTFVDTSTTFSDSYTPEPVITGSDANLKIYNYCDKYFQCYYGTTRVSPLFPMALANVETPGRADNTKTWCSLFPSRYADLSLIDDFSIVDVVSDPKIYTALKSDYSTKYRGPLQMSVTYGSGNKELNKRMGPSEAERLKSVDTSNCASWVSGASKYPGDRFNIPDMLLRLQTAMVYNIENMAKNNRNPKTDYQLYAMLAVGHNSGCGVWAIRNENQHVGNWLSAKKCYEWCELMSSDSMINNLNDYASKSADIYLTSSTATRLIEKVYPGLRYQDYTTSGINARYPLIVLYNQIKLGQLYSGGN